MRRVIDECAVEEIISQLSATILAKIVRMNNSQIIWLCKPEKNVSIILLFKLKTIVKSRLMLAVAGVSQKKEFDYVCVYEKFSIDDTVLCKELILEIRKVLLDFFQNKMKAEPDIWKNEFQLSRRIIGDLYSKNLINQYGFEGLCRQL